MEIKLQIRHESKDILSTFRLMLYTHFEHYGNYHENARKDQYIVVDRHADKDQRNEKQLPIGAVETIEEALTAEYGAR